MPRTALSRQTSLIRKSDTDADDVTSQEKKQKKVKKMKKKKKKKETADDPPPSIKVEDPGPPSRSRGASVKVKKVKKKKKKKKETADDPPPSIKKLKKKKKKKKDSGAGGDESLPFRLPPPKKKKKKDGDEERSPSFSEIEEERKAWGKTKKKKKKTRQESVTKPKWKSGGEGRPQASPDSEEEVVVAVVPAAAAEEEEEAAADEDADAEIAEIDADADVPELNAEAADETLPETYRFPPIAVGGLLDAVAEEVAPDYAALDYASDNGEDDDVAFNIYDDPSPSPPPAPREIELETASARSRFSTQAPYEPRPRVSLQPQPQPQPQLFSAAGTTTTTREHYARNILPAVSRACMAAIAAAIDVSAMAAAAERAAARAASGGGPSEVFEAHVYTEQMDADERDRITRRAESEAATHARFAAFAEEVAKEVDDAIRMEELGGRNPTHTLMAQTVFDMRSAMFNVSAKEREHSKEAPWVEPGTPVPATKWLSSTPYREDFYSPHDAVPPPPSLAGYDAEVHSPYRSALPPAAAPQQRVLADRRTYGSAAAAAYFARSTGEAVRPISRPVLPNYSGRGAKTPPFPRAAAVGDHHQVHIDRHGRITVAADSQVHINRNGRVHISPPK